jgi:hypothetical protein
MDYMIPIGCKYPYRIKTTQITGRKFAYIVIMSTAVVTTCLDDAGNNMVTLSNLSGESLEAGFILKGVNGAKIVDFKLDSGTAYGAIDFSDPA